MDRLVNVVTNEVISFITLQTVELGHVHWRKLHRGFLLRHLLLLLLLLHHHLLLRWLLTHLLLWRLLTHLLLLIRHAHLHVLVLLLIVSHLTTVVVVALVLLPVLVVIVLVATFTTVVVLAHLIKASATSLMATAATSLESSATTLVLLTIIGIVATLSLTHEASLHSTTGTTLVSRLVLQLDHINELSYVINVLISDGILSLILGLPEVNLQWFALLGEQADDLIKKLNGLLGLLHALVQNVTYLVFWSLVTKIVDFVVFEFDGDNWSSLFENLLDIVLGSGQWNVFDIKVRFKHLLLVLLNLTTLLQLTLFLVDMRRDEDSLTIELDLHVRRI